MKTYYDPRAAKHWAEAEIRRNLDSVVAQLDANEAEAEALNSLKVGLEGWLAMPTRRVQKRNA